MGVLFTFVSLFFCLDLYFNFLSGRKVDFSIHMRQNRLYPSICYYQIFSLAFVGQPDPRCTYGRNRKCRAQPLHLYLIRSDIDEKKKRKTVFP